LSYKLKLRKSTIFIIIAKILAINLTIITNKLKLIINLGVINARIKHVDYLTIRSSLNISSITINKIFQ